MDKPIHPNLARIASRYDAIIFARRSGQIAETDAYTRIKSLVAKDDFGVEWSISPETGEWRYRDKWGDYYYAPPPEYGMVSATPYDLQSGGTTYPRVTLYPVDANVAETEHTTPLAASDLKYGRLNVKYLYTTLIAAVIVCVVLYSTLTR